MHSLIQTLNLDLKIKIFSHPHIETFMHSFIHAFMHYNPPKTTQPRHQYYRPFYGQQRLWPR